MRRLALLLLVSSWLTASALPALADLPSTPGGGVSYVPPVEGPVVDPFRAPLERWGSGNRGIDYALGAGTPVRAAADGEVVFAGQVGGDLHVVVLHADGVRTSYSFLQSIAVGRGERVRQGQPVGSSGDQLHFGARVGDTYIDPRSLFATGVAEVALVPDEVRRPGSEVQERSDLARFLGAVGRGLRAGIRNGEEIGEGAREAASRGLGPVVQEGRRLVAERLTQKLDQLRLRLHYARLADPTTHALRLAGSVHNWWRQRSRCTPTDVRPPPLPERRVAVLVGGLGSSSKLNALERLDTAALGYRPGDVVRFSYRGGTVDEQPFGAADTTVDLRTSAKRLRDLLERLQRENPGVPVDLIGHSQGGVVAQTMLAYEYDGNDPRLPRVRTLVTLGSPHQGSDIATALTAIGTTTSGEAAEKVLSELGLAPFDLRGTSVGQLAETSEFLRKLNRRRLPAGVSATSIGARGDLLVPAVHTALPGGRNVVVSVPGGLTDHTQLPGSAAAHREVALAVAGLPPTCQTFTDMMADKAASHLISTTEDAVGASVWKGGEWVDGRLEELAGRATSRKR